jgi:carboxymethylenebutenolidase
MCDNHTPEEWAAYLKKAGKINRRQFGVFSAAGMAALMMPHAAHAVDVTESDVTIETPDGMADCYFVHPVSGASAAVLVWPDILGLRTAFRAMGKRLAEEGYAVLVVNPFYRSAKAPVVPEGASFADEETRNIVFPLAGRLTPETHVTDAKVFIGWLDRQDAVDTSRLIGTAGYCMGGPMVMRTAATRPDRIGAGASFHGGGLATNADDSPHLLIPKMEANFLIAIAENDDEKDPQAKATLKAAFADAGLDAEIEVYEGTMHGWCPVDSAVYNEAQAEKAWSRMLALFDRSLA